MMRAYKGFNKDLTCHDFQYKEGVTFKTRKTPKVRKNGFHACEYPLDCLGYYNPNESVYHEVEILGKVSKDSGDNKVATNRIRIGTELSFDRLTKLSMEYITERARNSESAHETTDYTVASNSGKHSVADNRGDESIANNNGADSVASNSGERSIASSSGDRSVASNSGNRSMASNSGSRSMASNSGSQSIASNSGERSIASSSGEEGVAGAFGINAKAKGRIGAWLVLAEWKRIENVWHRIDVKVAFVDGEVIKEDTLYKLQNGKFTEVDSCEVEFWLR